MEGWLSSLRCITRISKDRVFETVCMDRRCPPFRPLLEYAHAVTKSHPSEKETERDWALNNSMSTVSLSRL